MTAWARVRGGDEAGVIATRVAVPQILQIEAVECGAVAMAMVMAHFGLWLPLEQLRLAAGVSRDGSKASNLLAAARRYGMIAKAYRKEVSDLARLPMPLILHWNFNHFLVLEGIAGTRVFLNDPATGQRTVTLAEFEAAFTGVAISLRPGPDFMPAGAPPRPLRGLMARLGGVHGAFGLIGLIAILLVIPAIALPAFTRIFIDGVIVSRQRDWLGPLVVGLVAAAALRASLAIFQQRLLVRLQARLAVAASARFMWHMLRLPIAFFAQRHPGDVAQRVSANDRVADLLSGGLAQAILDVATTILLGCVMLVYDVELGAIAVALVAPNILLVRLVAARQQRSAQQEVIEAAKLHSASVGAIQSIETLKASGLEAQAFARWAGYQAKLLGIRRDLGVVDALVLAAPPLFRLCATILILGVGARRVIAGDLSIGTLVAFQALAQGFAEPISRLVGMTGTIRAAQADITRVDDALENPIDPLCAAASRSDRPPQGTIVLRGVTFGYSPLDPPLITDFDLTLRPGMRVALVGGSGSGKSTVAKLIAGLAQPWSGEILIDGTPIADMSAAERARIVATVSQEVFLFAGTVRDNLTLWNDAIDDACLIAALTDAAMLADILPRPGRLDAEVAEGGVNFSGGQRQRLEIARALVGDPAVLVLDEATAALDPITELRIDENLRRRGATCIIVAHRLSTIRDADEIVVMNRGRIVERGTHDTLLALGGEYAALIQAH